MAEWEKFGFTRQKKKVLPLHQSSIQFTPAQHRAFELYLQGENVFMTGPGGSGKTAMIKEIVKDAKMRNKICQVCALTGCAALLLECKAKTIHSWAGIGIAVDENDLIIERLYKKKYFRDNWKNVDILIIDEVSMMSAKVLELLNGAAQYCRKNTRLFGGIQVIYSGDFFQLAPIGNRDDPNSGKFCFESPVFNELFSPNHQIQFRDIFRQKDPIYSKILNQIRVGKISNKTIEILTSKVKQKYIPQENSIKPTLLYPLRRAVNKINKSSMDAIHSVNKVFPMRCYQDSGLSSDANKFELKYLKSNLSCEENLELKVGAQVMCIVNKMSEEEDYQLCNGSKGIITRFDYETGYPVVKFLAGFECIIGPHLWKSEKHTEIGVEQIPLILAWAITIHKAQGASIDLAEIDVGNNIFACGQTYVALSRVTSLEGLYLKNFNYKRIKVNRKVQEFYKQLTLSQKQTQQQTQKQTQKQKQSTLIKANANAVDLPQ
jgi:ATP-dependent DNA helicase PIF1